MSTSDAFIYVQKILIVVHIYYQNNDALRFSETFLAVKRVSEYFCLNQENIT